MKPSEQVIDVGHEAPDPREDVEYGDRLGDELDEQEDDEEIEEELEDEYRPGTQAVPMHSPGDDISGELLMDADELSDGRPRGLSRLRNRVFFQEDAPSRTSMRNRERILQRISLRRRKAGQQDDFFWIAILLLNLMSLAVLACLSIYLTQTDFFSSHQMDLFGTTVDNRFTVVSQTDHHAKILLKSGYSNSKYSEAEIAFANGELQVGRRALASSDVQSFYGMSIYNNGTAAFTNTLTAPMIVGEYLQAGKALVFQDGSVMTTAANNSGGVKQEGDLNLVSTAGSVVASAGGNPVLVVNQLGAVTIANVGAEKPQAMGIKLDAARGRMSIANELSIFQKGNTSSISTKHPLRLNATRIYVGKADGSQVTLTYPIPAKSSHAKDAETEDADEATTLEVLGQSSTAIQQGGNVRIAGGDGSATGGDVVIVSGKTTEDEEVTYGSVMINAELDDTASSKTEIGSESATHKVKLHGLVSVNMNDNAPANNQTKFNVAGSVFGVRSKQISINNRIVDDSGIAIESKALRVGTQTADVKLGGLQHSEVAIAGMNVDIDGDHSVTIGQNSDQITIGRSSLDGQQVEVRSESITLASKAGIEINEEGTNATTTVHGKVIFGSRSEDNLTLPALQISKRFVQVNAKTLSVGKGGVTESIALRASDIQIGTRTAGSSVKIYGNDLAIESQIIQLGSTDSSVAFAGKTVSMNATDKVLLGQDSTSVVIGGSETEKVAVTAGDLTLKGDAAISGNSLNVKSGEISLGGSATDKVTVGAKSVKKTSLEGVSIEIGSDATSISIGSESGTIDLKGTVTLNGDSLQSRRRLLEMESHVAVLNAEHVIIPTTTASSEFVFPFQESLGSVESAYDVQRERALFAVPLASDHLAGNVELSFVLTGLRLRVDPSSRELSAWPPSDKMRCRVYKQSNNSPRNSSVVLEIAGLLESCTDTQCDDGIFLGASSQRIVRVDSGDQLSARCSVSVRARGDIFVDHAQFSFTRV